MITGGYAALLALLYLALSGLVIRQRLRHGVPIGLGEAEGLLRASRAHGNFAEYVPFALVLILLLEQGGAPCGCCMAWAWRCCWAASPMPGESPGCRSGCCSVSWAC